MPKLQLKTSITFIFLGAFLGWFSHSAYNHLNKTKTSDNGRKPVITSVPDIIKNKVNTSTVSIDDYNKEHFIKLLKNIQYDDALLWYKKIESQNELLLLPILLSEIDALTQQSDQNAFKLLDVFLQEYYDNSKLLMIQANAWVLNGQIDQALDSFFLAKNYAEDNESYIKMSQIIHDFSHQVFKQFQTTKKWHNSIEFFKKLIEKEPQFPFYHLALAESYIKSNDNDKALRHLQLITEDSVYGRQASEMLETIVFVSSSNGIALEEKGRHYIVNTTIADFYQVKLLLDTGASYSSLSSYTIVQLVHDQLATKIGRNKIYTAGGKIDVDMYQLKKMSIGHFSVNDIIVAELDLESSSEKENGFDGLLGINFLNQFNFSIDQKTKKLMLSPKI